MRSANGLVSLFILVAVSGCGTDPERGIAPTETDPVLLDMFKAFSTPAGKIQTHSANSAVGARNPFFQSLGTNDRSCASCHQPGDGWSVTPEHIRARFDATDGRDPIFRRNDGANSPAIDDSTIEAKRAGYSMLLSKGLIRVGIGIPSNAEFELVAVDDPYGFASSSELSLFRRPPSSTNLKFLSAVMWDGRETFAGQTIDFDLLHQSNSATEGHAAATASLSDDQRRQIVDFESALYTATIYDNNAGDLNALGAQGGPLAISRQEFYIGINDVLGADPLGLAFDSNVFNIFDAWAHLRGSDSLNAARSSVARGQALFNTRVFHITDVHGLNDELQLADIAGTCSTCHDTPNAGNHSVSLPVDIGIADGSRRTPDMPLYTLRKKDTSEMVMTTDPGRALVTGRWKDIGKFKGPTLRVLAAKRPYFHNGMAEDLNAVVEFYDQRFSIGLSGMEKADLVAFLQAL